MEDRVALRIVAEAETAHSAARELVTQKDYPRACAAYVSALASFRYAETIDPGKYNIRVAEVSDELGGAFNLSGNFVEASRAWESALKAQESASDLPGARRCLAIHINLAKLYTKNEPQLSWPDYPKAFEHVGHARDLAEWLVRSAENTTDREAVYREINSAYALYLSACCQAANSEKLRVRMREGAAPEEFVEHALLAIESCRAREFEEAVCDGETFSSAEADKILQHSEAVAKRHLASDQEQRDAAQFLPDNAVHRISFGESAPQGGDPSSSADPYSHLENDERVVIDLIDELRRQTASFGSNRRKSPFLGRIKAALPPDSTTAIIQYHIGASCSYAVVLLPDGGDMIIKLGTLTSSVAEHIAEEFYDGYNHGRTELEYDRSNRRTGIRHNKELGWLSFVVYALTWEHRMRDLLVEVAHHAVNRILISLPSHITRLIISPHRALHCIPFHALPVLNVETAEMDAVLLGEKYEICYLPSLSLLTQERVQHGDEMRRLLLVENPTGDLPCSEAECYAIQQHYRGSGAIQKLKLDQARLGSFLVSAVGARIIHYSGHAVFDPEDPLRSGLVFSDRLGSYSAISSLLMLRNELTVLNGCESGMLKPDFFDNHQSFTKLFLSAGARCVIGSLWAIPDLPSALLMDEFYLNWTRGAAPASALCSAQARIRKMTAGSDLNAAISRLAAHTRSSRQRDRLYEQASQYVAEFGAHPFSSAVHWAAYTCNGIGFHPRASEAQSN